MSHTDSRSTTRELRLAYERRMADPNAERDRRNWNGDGLRWFKVYDKRRRRQLRYTERSEIQSQL